MKTGYAVEFRSQYHSEWHRSHIVFNGFVEADSAACKLSKKLRAEGWDVETRTVEL